MKRFVQYLWKQPLFLLFVSLYLLVHVEQQYGELFSYTVVWKPVLFILLCPLIIMILFYAVLRNMRKAAILSFFFSFIIFWGSEVKYFFMMHYPNTFLGKYTFLLPFYICLLSFLFYFIVKSKRSLQQFVIYLNSIFFLFILYELGQIILRNRSEAKSQFIKNELITKCDTCKYPNIYYIVLDGYSSGKILKSAFDYQNDSIENYLISQQFKILPEAKSNYNLTSYSIASTFNSSYSKEIDKEVFLLKDYINGVREIYHNDLFPQLKQGGYTLNNFSFFSIKNTPKKSLDFDLFNMAHLFHKHNLFNQIYNDLNFHFADWLLGSGAERKSFVNDKDQYNFKLTDEVIQFLKKPPLPNPVFNYIHYYTPHAPYTRDSNGNKINITSLESKTESQQYIDQIKYTNLIIQHIVTSIKKYDQKDKIIILQADHGFRFDDPLRYQDEFPNFCAVYFTKNELLRSIPPDLNNVNTFLYISNLFFGKNNSFLEPRQFALKYKTKNFH